MTEFDNYSNNGKRPFSFHADLSSFMPATEEEKAQQDIMRPSSTF